MHQIRFWLGLCPRPRWGSLQRSSRPPSCIKGALLLRGEGGEGGRKGRGRDIDGYMLAEEMEAVNFLIPDTLNKRVDILRHTVTSLDLRVSKLLGLYRSENSADHSRNCRKRRTKLFETEAY